jgi:phytol kinase
MPTAGGFSSHPFVLVMNSSTAVRSILSTPETMKDHVALAISVVIALVWQRICVALNATGTISTYHSRKLMHVGMGPLFIATWTLYSHSGSARWVAALVPLVFTLKFGAIGLGLLKDESDVRTMSRSGDPAELLRGPFLYGVVFVVATLCYWRTSPDGIIAVMLMCGGDGLADVIGRRWGDVKLPWSPAKSWAGSAAMLLAGWALAWVFVAWFAALGFVPAASASPLVLFVIATAATAVESAPYADIDNVTITAVALGTAWLLRAAGVWVG